MKNKKIAIEVDQLTVNYGKTAVLWDISLQIMEGSLTCVLGPNGAGKSTFIKALVEDVDLISGRVSFNKKPYRQMKKKIAYVPQRGDIDWDFPITVFETALMGRYGDMGFLKWSRKADRIATKEKLALLGLSDVSNRQISELSGGQQQRLFLARALLQDADVFLLDEPFAGVDHGTEKLIIELLKVLKTEGKTILVVHHDLNTAQDYFESALMLNSSLVTHGKICDVFTQENLSKCYGNRAVILSDAAKLSQEKSQGLK